MLREGVEGQDAFPGELTVLPTRVLVEPHPAFGG